MRRKKESRSINYYIDIDPTPTASEEQEGFKDPKLLLSVKDYAQDIDLKEKFARMSFFAVKIWMALLIVITFLQGTRGNFTINIFGFEIHIPPFLLDEWAFVAVFTTTTGSVFGMSYIVGKYLFKDKGD